MSEIIQEPQEPNYITNKDLKVSQLLSGIAQGTINKIEAIDIWGEGLLNSGNMITGFNNTYNINKYDQLVSNPPDKGRKIPNLIPLESYESSQIIFNDKRIVIPNNSVQILTLMGWEITNLWASEMARIIDNGIGIIIIYGFKNTDHSKTRLETELKKINFIETKEYKASNEFMQITIEPMIVYSNKSNPKPDIHDDL